MYLNSIILSAKEICYSVLELTVHLHGLTAGLEVCVVGSFQQLQSLRRLDRGRRLTLLNAIEISWWVLVHDPAVQNCDQAQYSEHLEDNPI